MKTDAIGLDASSIEPPRLDRVFDCRAHIFAAAAPGAHIVQEGAKQSTGIGRAWQRISCLGRLTFARRRLFSYSFIDGSTSYIWHKLNVRYVLARA